MKGIALHNPKSTQKPATSKLRREAAAHARSMARSGPGLGQFQPESAIRTPSPTESDRSTVNAGDLLTNAHGAHGNHVRRRGRPSVSNPISTESPLQGPVKDRHPNVYTSSPHDRYAMKRQESLDEDTHFRESITDCMLRAIGLSNAQSSITGTGSVEQSPRILSYDARSHRAVFSNNAFGFLDALEPGMDGDTESMMSVPMSTNGPAGSASIGDELSRDMVSSSRYRNRMRQILTVNLCRRLCSSPKVLCSSSKENAILGYTMSLTAFLT